MRIAVIALASLVLSGCATVSMTSGEATVSTDITASQSALRTVSSEYCSNAQENGWVAQSGSMLSFANALLNGQDEAKSKKPKNYAALIGAEKQAPATVFERIRTDAYAARVGLSKVSAEANILLEDTSEFQAGRSDVISYERALVNAQKAHRAFSKAADLAAQRTSGVPVDTETSLKNFADEIDRARTTADALAERYASVTQSVSS